MGEGRSRGRRPFLLGREDPAPVELRNADGSSSFVLTCEHAGRAVPALLRDRAPSPDDMDRHIAWDPGAARVARLLADRLDAPLVLQRYSRLVIDCNRPAGTPGLAPASSDGTQIPFNRGLRPADLEARWREIHQPFHRAVAESLVSRSGPILVSVHSCTRQLRGGPVRSLDLGLLSRREPSLAPELARTMRALAPGLDIRFNEPYRIEDDHDYTVPVHAEARSRLHVLLEIRNDLIADDESADRWASLLAEALTAAALAARGGRA